MINSFETKNFQSNFQHFQPNTMASQMEDDATEDEYFEQELLDFLQIIDSLQGILNNTNVTSVGAEPVEELECIITRFDKIDFPMPSDQWTRVYQGLKSLSQMLTKQTKLFESWTTLRNLFESGKKFRKKYPTPQSGDILRQNKQKQQMQMQQKQQMQQKLSTQKLLQSAKAFANDGDIKMKDPSKLNTIQSKQKMVKSIKQTKIKKPIKSEVFINFKFIIILTTTNSNFIILVLIYHEIISSFICSFFSCFLSSSNYSLFTHSILIIIIFIISLSHITSSQKKKNKNSSLTLFITISFLSSLPFTPN